tara:strand:+ start:2442 stop:2651 length:210 start_codon:yes stop_codon:yes gene_type:complete
MKCHSCEIDIPEIDSDTEKKLAIEPVVIMCPACYTMLEKINFVDDERGDQCFICGKYHNGLACPGTVAT